MIPSKESISNAHERIKPYIHNTPILTSKSINDLAGCHVFFKCENFQKIGAFKARGAMNAALAFSATERANGLATHSSGNHAQAVARAASIVGVRSFIIMPNTAPEIKKNGVLAYGGEIYTCEPNLASRERTLEDVVKNTGASVIHPYNDYNVIEGQATAAKEIFEELTQLDFLLVPVGGGGLTSGTALAAKYFSPRTNVIAVEPEGADDAFRSMQSGKIESSQANSIADGLLTSLGSKTFPIIQENVKEILTTSDREILSAMKLIWERLKIIIEPSSAVPLAGLLKQKEKFQNRQVGIILSGGNVDVNKVSKLL